ncbi:MAG: anthrone oxygenase family protein [Blastocatellia bacterium]
MTMIDDGLLILKILAAVGCGLNAGVFFAFSTFVMNAFGRLPVPQGIAAMQSVNITAINPLFMTSLFGTGAICLFWTVFSLLHWQRMGSVYLLFGGLLYVIGAVVVTMVFNVPLNNALAAVDPNSAEGANLWNKYLADWTFWNHIRTIAPLVSAVLFTMAVCYEPKR